MTPMKKSRVTKGQRRALATLAKILRDFFAKEEARG
jgi:hypothetical protein